MSETLAKTLHSQGSNNGVLFLVVQRTGRCLCFLCTGSAVTLLFEWHLCHVVACLQHELSSTEEKLFLCLRDSYSTHTLGH